MMNVPQWNKIILNDCGQGKERKESWHQIPESRCSKHREYDELIGSRYLKLDSDRMTFV